MKDVFKNKKVMIIVPHQDDELNIAGGLLCSDYLDKENTFIVYTTNGDYFMNENTRKKEAYKVAKIVGVPQKNIIFMGYPDQLFTEDNHVYMTHEPKTFVYKKNENSSNYNYEKLLIDYCDLLKKYLPDIIICIDFDSHPDHRATSLIVEKSIGMILMENENYRPIVYKGFAYPTSYKSVDDFDFYPLRKTEFKNEDFSLGEMQNPYYKWEERISFPLSSCVTTQLLFKNKLYKCIKAHRSQLNLLKRTKLIINSDNVFWERRTDNLCLNAKIEVSSGNKDYLNDFVLFDCEDIMHGDIRKPKLKEISWIPDGNDKDKEINIKFSKKKKIRSIVLYQNICTKERVKAIAITLDNGSYNYSLLDDSKNCISFDGIDTKTVKIKILKSTGKNAGFSEMEIFDNERKKNLIENNQLNKRINILYRTINKITLDKDIFIARVINKIKRTFTNY